MSTKVLVIDDSQMVRLQVGRALIGAGFSVIEAIDGLDAIEKLQANADVSLVICDVNMPEMNGIEFLEKKSELANGTPVIMLTTEGQPELIKKAKMLGAKGWIMKPFKSDSLIAAAKKLTVIAA